MLEKRVIHMAVLTPDAANTADFIAQWAAVQDRQRAQTYSNPDRRHDFLAGRSALRALLYQVTQKSDWRIELHPGGKPYLVGEGCPAISLSHSKGMIACAVSFMGEVGIDVEFWRHRDFAALAEHAFSPQEQQIVAEQGIAGFYRLWTLREAFAKAQGQSIFNVMGAGDCPMGSASVETWHEGGWSCFSTMPAPDYSLSCLVRDEGVGGPGKFRFIELE
jgi:phosphopantetheinyl transferase